MYLCTLLTCIRHTLHVLIMALHKLQNIPFFVFRFTEDNVIDLSVEPLIPNCYVCMYKLTLYTNFKPMYVCLVYRIRKEAMTVTARMGSMVNLALTIVFLSHVRTEELASYVQLT